MWRLGMSLEGTTLHVGEKVSLAGGAVRAEVNFIIRDEKSKDGIAKPKRYSSGIVTAKTKTILEVRVHKCICLSSFVRRPGSLMKMERGMSRKWSMVSFIPPSYRTNRLR